jgi:ABC-type sulfate transport system permease component
MGADVDVDAVHAARHDVAIVRGPEIEIGPPVVVEIDGPLEREGLGRRVVRDLGATPARAFWHVILPSLRPAIVAGGLMAFTLSLDELIVTFFTSCAASATLPIRIFGMAKVGLNPMLNALSALFIGTTAVFVFFVHRPARPNP